MSNATIRYYAAAQLKKRFLEGGKSQTLVFERLSQIVERYVASVKERGGERSGGMLRAFGEELVRMKGRFTARDGIPPSQIYRTPDAWIRVISGLAKELDENVDIALIKALEIAFATSDEGAAEHMHWLDELAILTSRMAEQLNNKGDLVNLTDYAARSGLMIEDGEIVVGEWPWNISGFIDGEIYDPDVLGFVPQVWGINYRPVWETQLDPPSSDSEWHVQFPEFDAVDRQVKAKAAAIAAFAGVRTGATFTIDDTKAECGFAFIEWHHSEISLIDESGEVIKCVPTQAEFEDMREEYSGTHLPGTEGRLQAIGKPSNWIPCSLRFHFVGSPGFARIAQSLIVEPWIYVDRLEGDFWAPLPQDTVDTPVTAPRHTVAAAIEGNLLYGDASERGDLRLDRLLARKIEQISSKIEGFRFANEAKRTIRREALFAEWEQKD